MVNSVAAHFVIGIEQTLVKVLDIRSQNKYGVIFRSQRIKPNGELLDTHNELIVKAIYRDLAVPVMPGQWWNVKGKVERRQFINNLGFEMTEDQMKVERNGASMVMPSGVHIVDYLTRNPVFQGIGRITAERLWEAFGGALFGILDSGDAESLETVVTPQKATMLVEGWREEGLSNSLQWLQAHGIPLKIGRRILGHFGSEADAKITENPYRLLSFSAGWREVDAIAREKLRIADDDPRRLVAAIEETVYRRFSLGHTYVPRSELFAGLRSILAGEEHGNVLIEAAIGHAQQTGRLLFDSTGNAYGLGASILENAVVEGIRLRIGRPSLPCLVPQIIYAYEGQQGHRFKLNQEQREAVHLIAANDFAVITGGAGCGKTTVLKCVHEILRDQDYDVTQLALAGKAVKRMIEATGKEAMTLASFIKKMREREAKNEKAAGQLIETRKMALVIDEASMVDLISFSSVLRLIEDSAKIVLIGDPHQLPPVGPGLILHCLTAVPGIPHAELKVAKRFGNEIANIANAVKDGSFPALNQFNSTARFIEAGAGEMEELGSSLYLKQPEESVVLCATRKVAGQINLKVQASLTKGHKPLRLFNIEADLWEHTGFHESDMLICTANHWDLGVQNGSLGRLIEVFDSPHKLDSDGEADAPALGWIEWDDGEKRPLREALLDSLELGYAMTVHKSQGSQWRRVIVCLPSSRQVHSSLIERSMIYTAITRAQSEAIVCGNYAYMVKAVGLEKAADRRKIGLPKRLERAGLASGAV